MNSFIKLVGLLALVQTIFVNVSDRRYEYN